MIVVVGSPLYLPPDADGPAGAAGRAVTIARAAAAAGAAIQLVGRLGDDPAGDATLLALSRDGIGHVAVVRDAGRATPAAPPPEDEPDAADPAADDAAGPEGGPDRSAAGDGAAPALDAADLEMALRYLDGFRVLVVAQRLEAEAVAAASEAATYVGALLVVLADRPTDAPDLPDAIVLASPETDPDGIFGMTVGRFAAAVDAGADPSTAFRASTAGAGWEPASA